jgi:hypothetical protein
VSTPKRPKARIESLADLIFGFALSIGAIALIGAPSASAADINTRIFEFMFTFFILITAWLIYTTQMSVLPVETRTVTFLNVVLLALVAVVPYLLNNVDFANPALSPSDASALQNYASILFVIDLVAILVILSTYAHIIASEEKKLVEPEIAKRFVRARNIQLMLSILLLLSLFPQLWDWKLFSVHLRLYVWYIPLLVYWIQRFFGWGSKN